MQEAFTYVSSCVLTWLEVVFKYVNAEEAAGMGGSIGLQARY